MKAVTVLDGASPSETYLSYTETQGFVLRCTRIICACEPLRMRGRRSMMLAGMAEVRDSVGFPLLLRAVCSMNCGWTDDNR